MQLYGVDPREIRILLNSDKLSAHGIDIDELRQLLEKSNFAVSAGRITDGGQRFSVRPRGEFQSIADIEDIVINENALRLGDVASIELRSPDRDYGRHLDRSYAIGVAVSKSTGSNMVEVTDRVMAEVEKISQLPQMQGIKIFDLDNQGDSVRDSLSDLLNAGAIGAVLALKRRIERIEGVSLVQLCGVDPREIRILLNSDKLSAHGIDIDELRQLLEKSNFAVSAGRITDGGQRFSVRPRGEIAFLEELSKESRASLWCNYTAWIHAKSVSC